MTGPSSKPPPSVEESIANMAA
jgi:hypothetical protein